MSIELTMPALSPTMEKGTLSRWLVKEGDAVEPGDLLAEIETDKVMLEFEAQNSGVVASILIAEGAEDVPVGTVIALLGDTAAMGNANPQIAESAPHTPMESIAPAHSSSIDPEKSASDMHASPLARCLAAAAGIDLSHLNGSGVDGKIVKADLGLRDNIAVGTTADRAIGAASIPLYPAPAGVPHQAIKLTSMRKTIARRLSEAKQTIPHFYLSLDIRIDELIEVRRSINESYAAQGVKVSINDFLIKALAAALERTPDAHVQYAGDRLYRFEQVDVSIAVSIPGGLVTPVIHDVGAKRLSHIAVEARDLAAGARAGTLSPEAYQGGTVSISNLGMYGVKQVTPVINTPQSLILGIGAGDVRPYAIDGQLIPATLMTVTASFDHRAIDGAAAADFLRNFKQFVEQPYGMLA